MSSVLSLRGPHLKEAGRVSVREWSRDRLRGGGSREGLQRARQTQCCSRITHLAKLNPNCHMNYSTFFTEISFSPETSIMSSIGTNMPNYTFLARFKPQPKIET